MWKCVSNDDLTDGIRECRIATLSATHDKGTHAAEGKGTLKDGDGGAAIASEAVIHNVDVRQPARELCIEDDEPDRPVGQKSNADEQAQSSQTPRRFEGVRQTWCGRLGHEQRNRLPMTHGNSPTTPAPKILLLMFHVLSSSPAPLLSQSGSSSLSIAFRRLSLRLCPAPSLMLCRARSTTTGSVGILSIRERLSARGLERCMSSGSAIAGSDSCASTSESSASNSASREDSVDLSPYVGLLEGGRDASELIDSPSAVRSGPWWTASGTSTSLPTSVVRRSPRDPRSDSST